MKKVEPPALRWRVVSLMAWLSGMGFARPTPAEAQEPVPAARPSATDAPRTPSPTPPSVAPPSPTAPAAAELPASKPSDEEAGEIVFHPTRSPDLETLAAGSMQQVRIGAAHGRYAMNIFGDVDFFVGNAASASVPGFPVGGTHPSFALGTLSFLITGELEKHFVSTAEFALEYDRQNQVGIDVERLQVGWLSEHFFVYAGRVHTALGYWSNAYHHGKWLQPTMERPRWVAFEDQGGLLPIHSVGVSAGPILDAGAGKVKITASVSNGRGNVVDDVRNSFDRQDSKAVHTQIEYIGLGLPELRVGVSGMYDRIGADPATRPALGNTPIDEYILGIHLAYPSYPLLVILEGYYVAHQVPTQVYRTYGGFLTLARSFGIVTPYVRGQWIGNSGGADPFFVPDPSAGRAPFDELEGIGGVRVDLTDWTAVRAEYRATKLGSAELAQLGVVQWTWGF